MNHSLSPFQKLFNFLDELYGKGKSMPRFLLGNEAKGIVYDAMPFTSHLIKNVDIVMKFFTQGNFCKLNGSLVLSSPAAGLKPLANIKALVACRTALYAMLKAQSRSMASIASAALMSLFASASLLAA